MKKFIIQIHFMNGEVKYIGEENEKLFLTNNIMESVEYFGNNILKDLEELGIGKNTKIVKLEVF